MSPADDRPQLSLVLACYDEAEHIERSVPQVLKVLDACPWAYEVIFVDDASRDGTVALIEQLIRRNAGRRLSLVVHERNMGRGGAVQDGFRAARGDIVGYMDIDLEVPPHYVLPCVLAVEAGADVCTARRIYRLHPGNLFRHALSRGYAFLARRLLGWPYADTESGFKFFRRQAALDLLPRAESQGWFWDTEIMFHAHRLGYKVVELPCLYLRRAEKTSTVKVIPDSLVYLRSLLRLAARAGTGSVIRAEAGPAENRAPDAHQQIQ